MFNLATTSSFLVKNNFQIDFGPAKKKLKWSYLLGDLSNGGRAGILRNSKNSRNNKNNVSWAEVVGGKIQGTTT